jgi:hypothetical protein
MKKLLVIHFLLISFLLACFSVRGQDSTFVRVLDHYNPSIPNLVSLDSFTVASSVGCGRSNVRNYMFHFNKEIEVSNKKYLVYNRPIECLILLKKSGKYPNRNMTLLFNQLDSIKGHLMLDSIMFRPGVFFVEKLSHNDSSSTYKKITIRSKPYKTFTLREKRKRPVVKKELSIWSLPDSIYCGILKTSKSQKDRENRNFSLSLNYNLEKNDSLVIYKVVCNRGNSVATPQKAVLKGKGFLRIEVKSNINFELTRFQKLSIAVKTNKGSKACAFYFKVIGKRSITKTEANKKMYLENKQQFPFNSNKFDSIIVMKKMHPKLITKNCIGYPNCMDYMMFFKDTPDQYEGTILILCVDPNGMYNKIFEGSLNKKMIGKSEYNLFTGFHYIYDSEKNFINANYYNNGLSGGYFKDIEFKYLKSE